MGQMLKYTAAVTITILVAATVYLLIDNIALRNSSSNSNPMTLEQLEELNTTSSERVTLDIISGTEYSPNDDGQFIIRLTDSKSNPLDGSCYASIAYPDKSLFISNQTMAASGFSGNYYIGFTIPSTYGIYEEIVTCYINTTFGLVKVAKASSFHVSNVLDTIYDTNQTIMTKLTSMQNSLTSLEANITSSINVAKADILNQMTTYYNILYNAIQNIPSSVITQISGEAPNWFSCVAQKITGVYPTGSKCK